VGAAPRRFVDEDLRARDPGRRRFHRRSEGITGAPSAPGVQFPGARRHSWRRRILPRPMRAFVGEPRSAEWGGEARSWGAGYLEELETAPRWCASSQTLLPPSRSGVGFPLRAKLEPDSRTGLDGLSIARRPFREVGRVLGTGDPCWGRVGVLEVAKSCGDTLRAVPTAAGQRRGCCGAVAGLDRAALAELPRSRPRDRRRHPARTGDSVWRRAAGFR
jgi:hypothetical protein